MKFRRLLAFILALTMLAGNVFGVYANDMGTADKEYTGEVSGSDITGGFPFDVSTDDISADDIIIPGENPINDDTLDGEDFLIRDVSENDILGNDISLNDIIIDSDVYEEVVFSSEEAHGMVTGLTNDNVKLFSANTNELSDDYYDRYYNQIGEPAQAIYDTILNNLDAFASPAFVIDVRFTSLIGDYANADSEDLKAYCLDGFAAFDYDHPEVFWLRPSSFAFSLLKSSSKGTYVGLRIKLASTATSYYQTPYDESPADIVYDKSIMEIYVAKIVEKTKKVSDFSGKIKVINDEISNLNYYNRYVYKGYNNQATLLAWESTSALSLQPWLQNSRDNGSPDAPVCEGYARAFKLVCNRLGISTLVVVGANHMWNYVKDPFGKWYAVDVTWDDPVSRSDGSGEWQVKETPEVDIDKYVLVGSETVISGSTFESRHPANGAFWRDGNSAFDVPELSKTAYNENVVVEDATFFVGIRDSEDSVITIGEIVENDEDKYFRTYSDASAYALDLSRVYPEKFVIIQLNWDFVFTETALTEIENTNVVLALQASKATFLMKNRYSLSGVKIKKSDTCEIMIRLSANFLADIDLYETKDANLDLNGYRLSVSEGKTVLFASVYGGSITLENNSKLVVLRGASNIISLEIPESNEGNKPFLLITDIVNLSISGGIKVKNSGGGKVNMGILISQSLTENYFETHDFSNLPLLEKNCTLFNTDFAMDYASVINPMIGIKNPAEVTYTEDKVQIRAIIYHLLAINEESSTEELLGSYSSVEDAFSYIDTVFNLKKKYRLRLSENGEVEGQLLFPENAATVTVDGASVFSLSVSDSISARGNVCFDSIILNGDNLTINGNLTLNDTSVVLDGNLAVNTLDMTDSTIVATGLVTITSLISRTETNSIIYGNPGTEYINSDGAVNLFRNGVFCEKFGSLQAALNKIETTGSWCDEFTIRINEDDVTNNKNLVFPSQNKASLITIVSNGEKRSIRYKDSLTINTNVVFDNVVLRPKYENTRIKLNDNCLTLDNVTMTLGTGIKTVTGLGTSGNSALILEGNTDVTIETIEKTGKFTVSASKDITVTKLNVGILILAEDSILRTLGKSTVKMLETPSGTWFVPVETTKNNQGKITSATSKTTIASDFDIMEGNGLTLVPVETGNGNVLSSSDFTLKALSNSRIKLVTAKKLSTGVYRNGSYIQAVTVLGNSGNKTVKSAGSVVMSSLDCNTYLIHGDRAVANSDINGAIEEIDSRETKQAYTIIPLEEARNLTKIPAAKNVSEMIFVGENDTILSFGNISFVCKVTLDGVNLSHAGNIVFKDVEERNGATVSATGAISFKNIYTNQGLTVKNTVYQKKSRIKVSGNVFGNSPVEIALYSNKAQTKPVIIGKTIDGVKWSNLVANVSENTLAGGFRVSLECLPEGCSYFGDDTNATFGNSYTLTKVGNLINCIYSDEAGAVAVKGENLSGEIPSMSDASVIGLFGGAGEALTALSELDGIYTIILLQDNSSQNVIFPKNVEKIVITSANNAQYTLNISDNITTYCDTVLSNITLGGLSTIDLNVKSGNLEISDSVLLKKTSKFGKATVYRLGKLILNGGASEKEYVFAKGLKGQGKLSVVSAGEKVRIKGKINNSEIQIVNSVADSGNVEILNAINVDKISLNSGLLSINAECEMADLIFSGDSEIVLGKEAVIGNIISDETEGVVSYPGKTRTKCAVSVNGKIEGKVKFNIITNEAPEDFIVDYSDNGYRFNAFNKLLNFKGTYNKNSLEFSINGDDLQASDYVFLSGTGMYYTHTSGYDRAINLTVLGNNEGALMNFADASEASKYIDMLNDTQGDYIIAVCYPCCFDATNGINKTELVIPSAGKYNSLEIRNVSESKEIYKVVSAHGSGNVTFKDFASIYVTDNIELSGEVTLDNSDIVCFGNCSVGTLNFDSDSVFYTFGNSIIRNVSAKDENTVNAYVGTMLSNSQPEKTTLTIAGYWNEKVKCRVFDYSSELKTGYDKSFPEINSMSNQIVSGTCRDEKGKIYSKDISEMQIVLNDSNGTLIGYFTDFASAVNYIDNQRNNTAEYVIGLITSSSIDDTIYMDGVRGHVLNIVLPLYAKSVRITTAEGENTAYLAYKTGSFEFKGKYMLEFDRVNLLEEKENRSPSTGSITVGKGTLVFTENTKTCKNGSFKTTVFCKGITCEKGTLVLNDIGLSSPGDVLIRNLAVSGNVSLTASGKTTLKNILGDGTLYIDWFSENLPELSGTVKTDVTIGLIPYVKNSENGKYENASADYISSILADGEMDGSKKLLTCTAASESCFFICNQNRATYTVADKEVKICKLNGSLYATILEEEVGLVGYNATDKKVYEGNFISLSQAFKEINRLSKSDYKYEISLEKNIGEGKDGTISPVSLLMPSKASMITFKGTEKAIFIKSGSINLKCDVVFDGVTPVYLVKNGSSCVAANGDINVGTHSLEFKNITGKYAFDSTSGFFTASSYVVTGSSRSRLIIDLTQDNSGAFTIVKKIKNISTVEISDAYMTEDVEQINIMSGISCKNLFVTGNINLYAASSDILVSNMTVCGTSEIARVWAKDIEIASKLTLENALVKAGTGTVGTGKFLVNNVAFKGENNEIDAKQDKNGVSMLAILGKTIQSNSQDNLKIGILYNNTASKYTQWYEGMRIFKGSKADLGMISIRFTTDTENGMGKAVDGYSLKLKSRKYVVISQ